MILIKQFLILNLSINIRQFARTCACASKRYITERIRVAACGTFHTNDKYPFINMAIMLLITNLNMKSVIMSSAIHKCILLSIHHNLLTTHCFRLQASDLSTGSTLQHRSRNPRLISAAHTFEKHLCLHSLT